MVNTSLFEQLKRLQTPQTSLLLQKNKRPSLLFDPREAANISRSTFYEIGISGLEQLIELNSDFDEFKISLFDETSKDFERAVENLETNQKLNDLIKRFLLLLSPYFLVKPTQKALEWLIVRYRIHEYNVDDLFCLALPYHGTRLFARLIQLFDFKSPQNSRWGWLLPVQRKGVPLSKNTLINQCISDGSLLRLICSMTVDSAKIFGDNLSKLATLFAFYCTTIVGVIQNVKSVTEIHMTHLLPCLMYGLSTDSPDYVGSVLIIIGVLCTKTSFKISLLHQFVNKIVQVKPKNLTKEMILTLNVLYQMEDINKTNIPEKAIKYIIKNADTFIATLKMPAVSSTSSEIFYLVLIRDSLKLIEKMEEDVSGKIKHFIESLLRITEFTDSAAESLIRIMIEIGNLESDEWYCKLVQNMENQYPNAWDNVVPILIKSELRDSVNHLLGFTSVGSHIEVFQKINDPNASIRTEVIKYIAENPDCFSLKYLETSLIARWDDEEPEVLLAMYQLPDSLQCYTLETLKLLLLKCWKNINTEWQDVLVKTIEKMSKLEIKNNQPLCILLLLPHLITQPKHIRNLILQTINIPFFKLIETDVDKKSILKTVIKHLQCDVFPDINDILFEFEQLNPESVYTMTVLFLICSRFHIETSSNTKQKVLKFFFEVILPRYNKKIKKNADCKTWDNNFIKEYFEKTRRGSLPVEIILHCIQSIVEGLKFEENFITIGPLNFSEDSSLVIVQLFRYLIINSFTEETKSAIFRSYIDLFLQAHFATLQSRVNFICSISVFYFVQENVRIFCAKLIYDLFKSTDESYSSWVLNLDTNNAVIPSLLTNIFTVNDELRSLSVKMFTLLVDCVGSVFYSDVTYLELIKYVVKQKEEVLLDYRQMIVIVNMLLNPDSRIQNSLPTVVRVRTKKILDELVRVITDERTPPVVSMTLLEMLEDINDRQLVCSLIAFATEVLNKENYDNLYEMTKIIINKLDSSHVPLFKQTIFRAFIDACFNQTTADGKCAPSNLLMSKLSIDNIFDNLDDDSKQYILNRMLDATVQPHASSEFLSGVSSFVKRITLACHLIVPYLISMENVIDQTLLDESRDKSRKESISEIREWMKGIKMLEYIQGKKKLTNTPNVIPLLFRLLQKCMEVEEEISMEYTKQVCLSCISNCAEKIDLNEADEETFEKIFNIELIVNCIRVSSNPQTHHHALMLLSQCSRFAPQQVLHNIMSIFTFMGSSVLRQDDSFSFQIIANIMQTLVPLLISAKNDKLTSEYPDAMVISCLKVFATSVLDIPDHRRLPLLGKLIRIVGQESFLWCFIVLVLERDVSDTKSTKPESGDSERVALIKDFCFEFDSGSILKCCSELLKFVNQLPDDKDSKDNEENYLFRIKEHSNKELRHMKYSILSFCSSILSSNKFISQLVTNGKSELESMEIDFAVITEESLKQLRSLMKHSLKAKNESSKYWKVLIYLSLDILNKVNALLPGDTFLNVLQNLLNHDMLLIKRKMLELLNWRLQRPEGDPSEIKNPDLLIKVIDRLLEIVADSDKKDSEVQLNCQTGLISLKLLTRVCNVSRYVAVFKKVLRELSNILKNMSVLSDPVLASTVLCIAELTFALKVHAIESLPTLIPALISLLTNHNNGSDVKNDVILLSVISSLYKVVEALPNFFSPYLESILYEVCVLPTRLQDQYSETKSNILNKKLKMLKQRISNGIADRVLLPLLCNCLVRLYENGEYDAVQYLMEILSESFKPSSGFSSDLIHLFLSGLEFRCKGITVDLEKTNKIESYIIEALCNIALKCSESSFRPFYLKLYDWGVLSVEYDKQKDKLITYYRILCKLSEKFKSLFIIFAPTFIRNAAQLLDQNNISKFDSPNSMYYGEDVNKAVVLVDAILYTLYNTFKYGTVKFITKERFNVLCEPLVDQIENTIGDYENRSKSIADCVAHFAAATTDDSLWKQFINLVLMKTRHSSYQVRLTALDTACRFATLLGDNFQPFLPETVPFIAELLEDENEIVEKKTRVAIQNLEAVLKEPIQKYF